jgi:hypothetical protein
MPIEELRTLHRTIGALIAEKRAEVLEQLRQQASALGFTADELMPKKKRNEPARCYQDPDNPALCAGPIIPGAQHTMQSERAQACAPRRHATICDMTNLLEEAVELLRDLPDSMQQTAARAIMDYAAAVNDVELSEEQVEEIERRMDDPNRALLSLADTQDRLRHFGL